LIGEQHPEPTHCQRPVFQRFFDGGSAAGAAWVVIDKASGKVMGSSRYYEYDQAAGAIAIGYTFLARTIGALVKRRKNWLACYHMKR
jgi:hypothetical protein